MADNFQPLTRQQLADMLGVSVSTIRAWEREFKGWVKVQPGKYGRAQAKRYGREDVHLFQVIHKRTRQGVTYSELRETLDEDLRTLPLEDIQQEEPPPGDASSALVPFAQYASVVAKYQATEGTLNAVTEERDYLRGKVDALTDELVDAKERAAAAKAELDMVQRLVEQQPPDATRQSWWRRVFGGGGSPSE